MRILAALTCLFVAGTANARPGPLRTARPTPATPRPPGPTAYSPSYTGYTPSTWSTAYSPSYTGYTGLHAHHLVDHRLHAHHLVHRLHRHHLVHRLHPDHGHRHRHRHGYGNRHRHGYGNRHRHGYGHRHRHGYGPGPGTATGTGTGTGGSETDTAGLKDDCSDCNASGGVFGGWLGLVIALAFVGRRRRVSGSPKLFRDPAPIRRSGVSRFWLSTCREMSRIPKQPLKLGPDSRPGETPTCGRLLHSHF